MERESSHEEIEDSEQKDDGNWSVNEAVIWNIEDFEKKGPYTFKRVMELCVVSAMFAGCSSRLSSALNSVAHKFELPEFKKLMKPSKALNYNLNQLNIWLYGTDQWEFDGDPRLLPFAHVLALKKTRVWESYLERVNPEKRALFEHIGKVVTEADEFNRNLLAGESDTLNKP